MSEAMPELHQDAGIASSTEELARIIMPLGQRKLLGLFTTEAGNRRSRYQYETPTLAIEFEGQTLAAIIISETDSDIQGVMLRLRKPNPQKNTKGTVNRYKRTKSEEGIGDMYPYRDSSFFDQVMRLYLEAAGGLTPEQARKLGFPEGAVEALQASRR